VVGLVDLHRNSEKVEETMKHKLTDNDVIAITIIWMAMVWITAIVCMTLGDEMEELKKDRECLHCEKFFECAGKPKEVDQCLMFEERKDKDVTV